MPILKGRTALQCYFDLMHSFHHKFRPLYSDDGGLVKEVAIGMGPAGELRYPSFRSEKWEFPGIGMLAPEAVSCGVLILLDQRRTLHSLASHMSLLPRVIVCGLQGNSNVMMSTC